MPMNPGPVNAASMLQMRNEGRSPSDVVAAARAEEERKRKEKERLVSLLGILGVAGALGQAGKGGESSPSGDAVSKGGNAGGGLVGGSGSKSSPPAGLGQALKALMPGGEKPGIVPALKNAMGQGVPAGQGSAKASIAEGGGAFGGGAPMRETGMSNDGAAAMSKVFPMAFTAPALAAAGGGGGMMAGLGGFLSSPVGGATAAAGVDLLGGMMGGGGGGDSEEVAKDQLRAQRQMNLFDGFREWNDRLSRRNEEMRAVLASLGNN